MIEIRVWPDLGFLAGCRISGRINKHALPDIAGYSSNIFRYPTGVIRHSYLNPALPDIRPNAIDNMVCYHLITLFCVCHAICDIFVLKLFFFSFACSPPRIFRDFVFSEFFSILDLVNCVETI